jgi:hypothetical protein
MNPGAISLALLEEAVADNGFDLAGPADGVRLPFASSQTGLHIWLRVLEGPLYILRSKPTAGWRAHGARVACRSTPRNRIRNA